MVYKPHVSLDRRDATEALLANTSESITELTVEGKYLRLAVTPQTAISILNRQPRTEKPFAYTKYAVNKYRVDDNNAHTNKCRICNEQHHRRCIPNPTY